MEEIPQKIVSFWQNAGPKKWFQKSDDFDADIRDTYLNEVLAARSGDLDDWRHAPVPCLALILLLDQFPRNIFRGTPDMFVADAHAVVMANHAIERGHDQMTAPDMRAFIYMPFMHSEMPEDQSRSVSLFAALNAPENMKHAKEHAEIIAKFDRFPHRNAILNRVSTA